MSYWNEINDNHIRLIDTDVFKTYPVVKGRVNKHGYVDAEFQPSQVLYMGTCDIISPIEYPSNRWIEKLHTARSADIPLIAIGSPAAGIQSTIRRLYSYIKNFGPPKTLYLTLARFDGYEYVNKSGRCYNVNSRIGTPQYLKKRALLADDEYNVWIKQIDAYKNLYNIHNNRYLLEERFAFLETICTTYNIKLQWTFNPSDACIVVLHRNIDIFDDISPFMKESFVGIVTITDQHKDRSIGPETHNSIYNKFMYPDTWDFKYIKDIAETNYRWLETVYGDDLIKNEG